MDNNEFRCDSSHTKNGATSDCAYAYHNAHWSSDLETSTYNPALSFLLVIVKQWYFYHYNLESRFVKSFRNLTSVAFQHYHKEYKVFLQPPATKALKLALKVGSTVKPKLNKLCEHKTKLKVNPTSSHNERKAYELRLKVKSLFSHHQ